MPATKRDSERRIIGKESRGGDKGKADGETSKEANGEASGRADGEAKY